MLNLGLVVTDVRSGETKETLDAGEGLRIVWRELHGLAEVLAGPGAADRAGHAWADGRNTSQASLIPCGGRTTDRARCFGGGLAGDPGEHLRVVRVEHGITDGERERGHASAEPSRAAGQGDSVRSPDNRRRRL